MKKIFIRGLVAIAPLALTLALVTWLFSFLENGFGRLIKAIIGPENYFPGLGILVALVLIFFVGTIVNNWVVKKLYNFGDQLLHRIPLFKTIYSSLKDLFMFFHEDHQLKQSYVATIEIMGMRLVGFVTREKFDTLPEGIGEEGEVAVYLPMSYQIGGYTVVVPRSKVHKISMTFEESMRFVITAGILGKKK